MKKLLQKTASLVLTGILIFSVWKILQYYLPDGNNSLMKQKAQLQSIEVLKPSLSQGEKIIGESTASEELPKSDETMEGKKLFPENSYIQKLQEENSDIRGWIKIVGTSIDYPLVQGKDNEFYLTHDALKMKNVSGAIFMDYRTDFQKNLPVLYIYGHNMKKGTMFFDLNKYLDQHFLKEHAMAEVDLPQNSLKYEILEATTLNAEHPLFHISKDGKKTLKEMQKVLKSLSREEENEPQEDQYLLLCTCYTADNQQRTVVLARKVQ